MSLGQRGNPEFFWVVQIYTKCNHSGCRETTNGQRQSGSSQVGERAMGHGPSSHGVQGSQGSRVPPKGASPAIRAFQAHSRLISVVLTH